MQMLNYIFDRSVLLKPCMMPFHSHSASRRGRKTIAPKEATALDSVLKSLFITSPARSYLAQA